VGPLCEAQQLLLKALVTLSAKDRCARGLRQVLPLLQLAPVEVGLAGGCCSMDTSLSARDAASASEMAPVASRSCPSCRVRPGA